MSEQDDSNRASSKKKNSDVNWVSVLRITAAIAGLVVIAIGVYQLSIFKTGTSLKLLINALYQVIFGVLVLVEEFRWMSALVWFRFLSYAFGIGMYHIFVGGLALGGENWQYAVAVVFWLVGLTYIVVGFFVSREQLKLPKLKPKPKETKAQNPDKEMGQRRDENAEAAAAGFGSAVPGPTSNDQWNTSAPDYGGSSAYSGSSKTYISPHQTNPYESSGAYGSGSMYGSAGSVNTSKAPVAPAVYVPPPATPPAPVSAPASKKKTGVGGAYDEPSPFV